MKVSPILPIGRGKNASTVGDPGILISEAKRHKKEIKIFASDSGNEYCPIAEIGGSYWVLTKEKGWIESCCLVSIIERTNEAMEFAKKHHCLQFNYPEAVAMKKWVKTAQAEILTENKHSWEKTVFNFMINYNDLIKEGDKERKKREREKINYPLGCWCCI